MTTWHKKTGKKVTGGLSRPHRKKRKHESGKDYLETGIKERKLKVVKGRSSILKQRLLSINIANVSDGNKSVKSKILRVVENPANIHFVRRNTLTKGAIIETELGKAVVTSRPGQSGVVNAKLIEEKNPE